MKKDFTYYTNSLAHLHTARLRGFMAPHKPLLLLAIMDLVERGVIRSPRIYLTDALQDAFKANVDRYIGFSLLFRPNIGQPFYHMQHEPFWQLVLHPEATEPKNPSYAPARLKEIYRYALIDEELFHYFQDANARAQLRVLLISTYFSGLPSSVVQVIAAPVWGVVAGWIA